MSGPSRDWSGPPRPKPDPVPKVIVAFDPGSAAPCDVELELNDSHALGWVDGWCSMTPGVVARDYANDFHPRAAYGEAHSSDEFYFAPPARPGLTYVDGTLADYEMGFAAGLELRQEAEALRVRVEAGEAVSAFESGRYEAFSLGVATRKTTKELRADHEKYLRGRGSIMLPRARHDLAMRQRWVRTPTGFRMAGYDEEAEPL